MNRKLLFRIFYAVFFVLLNLILLGLLLITPSDAIQQALSNHQLYNVFVIAGAYFVTLVLAVLIYASRLYTTKSVLAAIPKTWIPVEKGDVSPGVRKMIADSLARSAVIAWNARPRVNHIMSSATSSAEKEPEDETIPAEPTPSTPNTTKIHKYQKLFQRRSRPGEKAETAVLIPSHAPVWGNISHDGWASPTSIDLPNLQYTTVILELPHLIEAKAVSLAPADPDSTTSPPMPDLRAVDLLQRPAPMGLRGYLTHLTSIRVLPPTAPVLPFLNAYESARFSAITLSEAQFRSLMALFADLLRAMTAPDPAILEEFYEDEDDEDYEDAQESERYGSVSSSSATPATTASPASSQSNSLLPSPNGSVRSRSLSEATVHTVHTAPSRRRPSTNLLSSSPSKIKDDAHHAGAPSSVVPSSSFSRSRKNHKPRLDPEERYISRGPSVNSFAQTKKPYPVSQASSGSLRTASESASVSGSAASSVIRLRRDDDDDEDGNGMPFVIVPPSDKE